MKFLLRGDAEGRLAVWKVPDTPECAMMQLKRSEAGGNGEVTLHPIQSLVSLDEVWAALVPTPPGVLNQVCAKIETRSAYLTYISDSSE